MPSPTPLEPAPAAFAAGRPLFLKREDAHELGAFKWRGALPTLERFRERGAAAVVTASTGNHGAATAWAAERTGMRALVFLPAEASAAKLRLLADLGAELHQEGADLDESKDHARAYAAERRLPFFEDGAEPAQYEGYEAIGREIVAQLGERPGLVPVPVGNGALLIGVARGLGGGAAGVVSKEAPVMAWSVAAGRPVECDRSATFADGLAVRVAVPLAVRELVSLGTPFVEVSDRAIARAVGSFARAGIRVEGSAGASLAALEALGASGRLGRTRSEALGASGRLGRTRSEALQQPDGPVVLMVCGSNIDDDLHRRAVEDPESFPD